MGIDDRDDEYRSRGQGPRRRNSYDDGNGASSGRSSQRGPRDDAYRGRSRGYDDESSSARGSSRRDYNRQDDRSSGRSDRDGYERRGRPDQSYPPNRRRDDWDGGGRGDPYGRGGSSGRGPRPPMRDDRGRSRGPSPADSGSRGRRPGAAVAPVRGGGLWGDEPMSPAGRRRPDLRDPRAARRGAVQEGDEETSGAAAFGKGLLVILLALLIGAGASYGYYVVSTPKPPATAAPSASPSASPKASPSASSKSTATAKSALPSSISRVAPATVMFVIAPDASAD